MSVETTMQGHFDGLNDRKLHKTLGWGDYPEGAQDSAAGIFYGVGGCCAKGNAVPCQKLVLALFVDKLSLSFYYKAHFLAGVAVAATVGVASLWNGNQVTFNRVVAVFF